MRLSQVNELLRGVVGEMGEAKKDPFATPGKSLVNFWVPLKRGMRRSVDVITVNEELKRRDDGMVDDASYRSILSKAMNDFERKHPGKWKRVRHNSFPKSRGAPLLHNGKAVSIQVEMKPPRGWKG